MSSTNAKGIDFSAVLIKTINLNELKSHPATRPVLKTGDAWGNLKKSILAQGVIFPLLVRAQGAGYEVVAGNRRLEAARALGLNSVPCMVYHLSDDQAADVILHDEFQHSEIGVVQGASLIQNLFGVAGTMAADVAKRACQGLSWAQVRLSELVLRPDISEALDAPEEGRRLSEGAFREILKAPQELRERAVQLVLSSEGFDEPLSEARAMEEIQYNLIPAWKKEKEWADGMEKRRQQVAKELMAARKVPNPNIINVQVQPWGSGSHGILQPKPALDKVSNPMRSVDAPEGLTWLDLAERMNAPVYVVPPNGDLMVRAKQMFDFDQSLHEYAGQQLGALADKELKPWLKSSKPVRPAAPPTKS